MSSEVIKVSDIEAGMPLNVGEMYRAIDTVRTVVAPDLTDDELRLFALVASRSGLDVFARQIFAIKRKGRVTFQTSIDGYRSISSRSGYYDGIGPVKYGPVCKCDEPPVGHPEWAQVQVWRKGISRPFIGRAEWHETAPGDMAASEAFMWRTKPRLMIGKCAEAQAHRRAFPWDATAGTGIPTGLYVEDEITDEPAETPARSARERIRARAQAARGEVVEEEVVDAGSEVIDESAIAAAYVGAQDGQEPEPADDADPAAAADTGQPEAPRAAEAPAGECGVIAGPGGVAAGDVCDLQAGHAGVHHSRKANSSWPR